jgi:uncharacterized protein (TIGR00251 family)
MTPQDMQKCEAEFFLSLKVSPKASRNAIVGWYGEALKVSVTAVPDKGKANVAVIKLLAKALALPKSALRIARGDTQREKLLAIRGPSCVLDLLPPRDAA